MAMFCICMFFSRKWVFSVNFSAEQTSFAICFFCLLLYCALYCDQDLLCLVILGPSVVRSKLLACFLFLLSPALNWQPSTSADSSPNSLVVVQSSLLDLV